MGNGDFDGKGSVDGGAGFVSGSVDRVREGDMGWTWTEQAPLEVSDV